MKHLCPAILLASGLAVQAQSVVTNIRGAQQARSKLVDIYYDLVAPPTNYTLADPYTTFMAVSVAVSTNNGATFDVPATTFTGDIGVDVRTGLDRRIVWDAGRDWPGQYSTNVAFRITAQAYPPTAMVLIPAGSYTRGDTLDGDTNAQPTSTITVSAFYIDRCEVTKALWDQVRTWANNHSYDLGTNGMGKATNHPVHTVSWHDCVKWCNARSEMEGRTPAYYRDAGQTEVYRSGTLDLTTNMVKWNAGYRLPTESEWEKAARGGVSGRRFPWSGADTISHARANYYATNSYTYDVSATQGYHPAFTNGVAPYASPVGYFAPNGYGLYDMAGNVMEWTWDAFAAYASGAQTDPRGGAWTSARVVRGGCYYYNAGQCRSAFRSYNYTWNPWYAIGFRVVLATGQP